MNQPSLFAPRAAFTWGFLKPTNPKYILPIIWIEDLDKGKSVTNDIDNVIADINKEVIDITGGERTILDFLIMCRDTLAVWDGVTVTFISETRSGMHFSCTFFSIHKQEKMQAAEKLWDTKGRGAKATSTTNDGADGSSVESVEETDLVEE